ncbi:MAG: dTDP-glucose 4,6-dehydratase [Myxococcota bacterium]
MSSVLLVSGAAGFIGSFFVEVAIAAGYRVIILDSLTYAGKLENLEAVLASTQAELVIGNICNGELVTRLLTTNNIDALINFAAESHVDRSIENSAQFIQTNIIGTYTLLEAALTHFQSNPNFRFIQISTDEVYGELGPTGKFNEETPERPNSPYSASKAAGDMLANAWFHTYGLPVITTHCSNNYGPRQDSEKLIPHLVRCALEGKNLPVYGDGTHVRDWIHVEDHCDGIMLALEKGAPGQNYCFGGDAERTSLQIAEFVCDTMGVDKSRIEFIADRRGHDRRYAIDDSKAQRELGFKRKHEFEQSLKETIHWYVEQYNSVLVP